VRSAIMLRIWASNRSTIRRRVGRARLTAKCSSRVTSGVEPDLKLRARFFRVVAQEVMDDELVHQRVVDGALEELREAVFPRYATAPTPARPRRSPRRTSSLRRWRFRLPCRSPAVFADTSAP